MDKGQGRGEKIMGNLTLMCAGLFFVVFVWVGFDIHNRLPYAMLAQVPMLICLLIYRSFR